MPTRNLTIMFTDIKGFTSRTSVTSRKELARLVEEHKRLLLPVFKYFDGITVKSTGDGFLVHFESPTDGVLCGVTIQEVLRKYNLSVGENDKLEVRVAINAGEVELKEDDVLGEAVNIASRLEAITEAGEVYFTEAVYQTMKREEAPSAEVGERIFNGIPHPIRVYKVINDSYSDLGRMLSRSVELSDRGPIIKGIRNGIKTKRPGLMGKLVTGGVLVVLAGTLVWTIIPSKTERVLKSASKLMENGAYVEALELLHPRVIANPGNTNLVQQALHAARRQVDRLTEDGSFTTALDWIRQETTKKSYLSPLQDLVPVLDTKATVTGVFQREEYASYYYPDPLKELLKRYPENAEVPYLAAQMLEDRWHSMTTLWLYGETLQRGGHLGDEHIFDFCVLALSSGRVDYDRFNRSHQILGEFYPEKRLQWARNAMDTGGGMAIANAWRALKETNDPLTGNEYYIMLYELVVGEDRETMASAYEVFVNQNNPKKQEHLIALHEEMHETFPQFFSSRKKRDAVALNLQRLKKSWGVQ